MVGGILLLVIFHTVLLLVVAIAMLVVAFFKAEPDATDLEALLGMSILFIGVTQVLYVLPSYVWLHGQKRRRAAKGLVTGAIITLLLNAFCFACAALS